MKKIFSLLIVLTCILSVNAQDFKFGVSGGMNLNSITNNENKIGYNVGVKGEYFFKDDKGLYLDMGIMLTNKNWKHLIITITEINPQPNGAQILIILTSLFISDI